jgi:hypothetical protein
MSNPLPENRTLEAHLIAKTTEGTPRPDLFDTVWRASGGATATILLAVTLALTLSAAAVFPQQPLGLDSAAEERWLSAAAGGYPGLGPILRNLGIFNLLGSPWCRILLALIAYHLLLRLANQARATWLTRHQAQDPTPVYHGLQSREIPLSGPLNPAMERLSDALVGRYPALTLESSPEGAHVYAERRGPEIAGPLVSYLGGLCLLLGFLLNGAAGWVLNDVTLAPGGSARAPGTSLDISLKAIAGNGADAVSSVVASAPGGAHSGSAGYTHPFIWGSLWIVQRATGPALAVTARDASGKAILLQRAAGQETGEAISLPFTSSETEQAFAAPQRDIIFRVVNYPTLPEQGYSGPVFLIEAYAGSDLSKPILSRTVENEATIFVGDATFVLRREQHAVLSAASVPGLAPLAMGGLILLAGIVLSLWWGHAQAWIDVTATGDALVAVVSAASPAGDRGELLRLVRLIAGPEAVDAP